MIVDNDEVSLTNLNRQIHANINTIGKYKVDVMKDRMLTINPEVQVKTYKEFYLPNLEEKILDEDIDYIVDAIDTVTAKIELVVQANKLKIPIISSMGTGNKLEPTRLEVCDIYQTSICPLAKVMRRELRKREIPKLKVVYSKEEPIKPLDTIEESNKRQITGSVSFVQSVAGLIIASEVVKDLIKIP